MNMMNKSVIKKLMLICLILIVILIIAVIGLKIGQKKETIEIKEKGIEKVEEIDGTRMTKHETSERFFTVAQCISSYLDIINTNNTSYFGRNENGEYVKVIDENEKIYNLLSTQYKQENNITVSNANNFVPKVEEKLFFVPLKMEYVQSNQNNDVYQYGVYGQITDLNYEKTYYLYIIINMDFANNTFSIEPQKEDIQSIEEMELKSMNKEIEQNDDNMFKYKTVNSESLIQTYMDYYKKLLLGNPQLAYEYLKDDYKEKRFGSIENFKKYLERNKEEIKAITPNQYLINSYENYTQYVCQDQYENVYIFNEKSVMDFTIELDTYTIPTEKFIETYQTANESKKVMLNIDKWVQMLNNRDYNAAYQVLDETYRNNTYGKEEEFEAVMTEHLPLHYKVEYGENSEENGTYIQKIILTDITEETNDNITISVIMQLKEDLDFVMSFSFTEEEPIEELIEE